MNSARDIHMEMVARNFSRNRRFGDVRYEGMFIVRGRRVSVAVVFPTLHLGQLPKLYLIDHLRDLPDAVAHIEDDGKVCYAREEELVLDPLDPRGSIALCMLKMQEALDRVAKHELQDEIAAEFPQHWQGAVVYFDLPLAAKSAYAFSVPHCGKTLTVVAESSSRLKRFDIDPREMVVADAAKAPIVLLTTERELTFNRHSRLPNTLAELLVWLAWVAEELPRKLLAGLGEAWPKSGLFFLRAPNGIVGGKVVIPPLLKKATKRSQFLVQQLERQADVIAIQRFVGISLDPSFIYRRNMAGRPNLSGKNIAVVGVGTIGGWLARFLAQSGAGIGGGRLILFDEQTLQPGNLGRHWLSTPYIGVNKAVGARNELRRTNPDCDVTAISESAFDHISTLAGLDLVIDATGERAVSDVLNADFLHIDRSRKEVLARLHVWLVGGGVAAQALLVDSSKYACFRCLRATNGDDRFQILDPKHPAILTPASCGEGSYFAYGVGASAIAAGLAVQMCLDWVNEKPSPRFRTVRINHEAAFQVKDANVGPLEKCPACSQARC